MLLRVFSGVSRYEKFIVRCYYNVRCTEGCMKYHLIPCAFSKEFSMKQGPTVA